MAGISSKAAGSLDNKKEYNGNELQSKEFSDGSGLEMYDFNARTYDQQLGRFFEIDPMTEEGGQESLSPYHFSYNNPIRYNDPSGKAGEDCCKVLGDAANWVGDRLNDLGNSSAVVWVNNNLNPLTPVTELVTGKSLNSGFTEDKSRLESGAQLAVFAIPTAKVEAVIAGEIKNIVVGQVEKQAINNIEKQALKAEVKAEVKAVESYKRPSGATTEAQRASVQGKPCVTCGETKPKMVADHKTPLVKEHYQTGTIDKKKMTSTEAVQPQCPTCSARQGAEMSRYSKEQKKLNGIQ
jgi:RHS repeat-associated protein